MMARAAPKAAKKPVKKPVKKAVKKVVKKPVKKVAKKPVKKVVKKPIKRGAKKPVKRGGRGGDSGLGAEVQKIGSFGLGAVSGYGGGNGAVLGSTNFLIFGGLWVLVLLRFVLFY